MGKKGGLLFRGSAELELCIGDEEATCSNDYIFANRKGKEYQWVLRASEIAEIHAAQEIAFAYGGEVSDYYKVLDDSDPKVQELMGLSNHLDKY